MRQYLTSDRLADFVSICLASKKDISSNHIFDPIHSFSRLPADELPPNHQCYLPKAQSPLVYHNRQLQELQKQPEDNKSNFTVGTSLVFTSAKRKSRGPSPLSLVSMEPKKEHWFWSLKRSNGFSACFCLSLKEHLDRLPSLPLVPSWTMLGLLPALTLW